MTHLVAQTVVRTSSPVRSQADDDLHLVDLWLHGKSSNTQEAYRRDVNQFVDFVDLPLGMIKLQHFWEWSDHLEDAKLARSTRARKLAALKSLFSFGHRIGYLEFNIGAAVSLPNVPDRLSERILPEVAVARILEVETDLRNSVLLRLFYVSGGRVSELAKLFWGALMERHVKGNPGLGQVTLLGKGNKTRTVLLSRDTWMLLQQLKQQEISTGYGARSNPVFRSRKGGPLSRQQIWRIVRRAARNAGLEECVSPHWLRHAHASHALDNGAPMHLVKETLGHKSLTTTSRYAHAKPDDSSSRYLKV